MAFQILINILMAFIWMLLQNNYSVITFLIGYIIGIVVLFALRRFLVFDFYFKRVWAFFKLTFIFFRELILANIDMIKIILKPKMDIKPGIIAIPTKLDTDMEVTLFAALISLTPGTLSMDFSDDSKVIFVHAIDIKSREETIRGIHESFENAILEVTE
ncbi:Na+/H+ antiporter subunit E [Virgibacillus kimchii]